MRFTDKTNAMVESHQVREESGFPVVHPPPGSDVYLIARLWQWWPILEIDFLVTRGLVDGVLLTGCRTGDCHYRRGIEWMEQRIGGRRDPYLRRRVPRERVAWTWLGVDGEARLRERIRSLREDLRTAGPHRRAAEARGDAVAPDSSGAAPGDP